MIPEAVQCLVEKENIEVFVELSPIRIFPAQDYRDAGAKVVSDLGKLPSVVFGVKQIPCDVFRPATTYFQPLAFDKE